jgi:hypothetical protein
LVAGSVVAPRWNAVPEAELAVPARDERQRQAAIGIGPPTDHEGKPLNRDLTVIAEQPGSLEKQLHR